MARGRFIDVNPSAQNLRAIWSQIHALQDTNESQAATILAQQGTITSLQSTLTSTSQQAKEALLTAGQALTTVSAAGAVSSGTTPPVVVDTMVIPDHSADVLAVWTAAGPMVPSVAWAFLIAQTLSWQFNAEIIDGVTFPMGLLIKASGDNIFTCGGVNYSASRVCYPNGHIFKILTDVPTTNGPEWVDDGFVDPQRYAAAIDPAIPC